MLLVGKLSQCVQFEDNLLVCEGELSLLFCVGRIYFVFKWEEHCRMCVLTKREPTFLNWKLSCLLCFCLMITSFALGGNYRIRCHLEERRVFEWTNSQLCLIWCDDIMFCSKEQLSRCFIVFN